MTRRQTVATLLCFSLATIAGCSREGPVVMVKGKLTNAGKSVLKNRATDGVMLVFFQPGEAAKRYTAAFSTEDDKYYVYGPTGKGIPSGKYRVAVTVTGPSIPSATEKLNQQFSEEKTPIEVDVQSPEPPIEIDLSKYQK